MVVPVSAQDSSEEGGAGGEDDLVGLQLVAVLAGQRHVKEVLVVAQLAKCAANVRLEIVPPEAELLCRAHDCAEFEVTCALVL